MITQRYRYDVQNGKIQFLFVLVVCSILSSCSSFKFIKPSEALLRDTEVVFDDKFGQENQSSLKYELEQLIRQKAPRKFLFVPRDYYYLKNQDPGDTLWYQKFAKKNIAEGGEIFDSLQVYKSASEMQRYLRNKKGYFDAVVIGEYKVKSQKAKTKFRVTTEKQFTVDSVFFRSNNPEIQEILDEIKDESTIKEGSPIDATLFDIEKERIFQELQNRGYANFVANNTQIKGDSTHSDKKVDILFELSAPNSIETFQKYYIGEINVYTDFDQDKVYPRVPSKVINGKNYHTINKNFVVKPRSIDRQIFLKSGQNYNRSNHYQTIRKLSSLGTYKFVKVSPTKDLRSDSTINYNIYLTPHQHKWIAEYGTGAFYSTINTKTVTRGSQQLFGFSADGSLVNRNAFGGSEKNQLIAEAGIEFQILPFELNSYNFGISDVLSFPRQVDYLGLIGLIYSVGKIPTEKREKYEVATSTSFTLGWNFQDILEFSQNNIFSGSANYNYRPDNNWEISFTPTGFDILDYERREAWDSILQQIPILDLSFNSSVFTGILFKEVSALYTANESPKGFSWSILGSFELSGGEIHLANRLGNVISGNNNVWQINNELDFSNFAKFQLDWRMLRKLRSTSSLAARVNLGIASPYGDDEAVPYIRQFFVGGPNSMRAWQSRELGPGGYVDPNQDPDQRFFQTGDIKTEFNIEYRADLFSIFDYALFIDAGNVWTLKPERNRPNTNMKNFYNQLAMGWGWGLRLDFTYFILRFDFGYKLKNPFLNDLGSYYISPVGQGFGNANVAINYPF